jgi:hypothetical protein
MDITILDLDGCISDDRWRRSFIDRERGEWDQYHCLAYLDQMVNRCFLPNDATFAICTGRPEKYRSDLNKWLERNILGVHYCLMRKNDDLRSAVLIKQDMVEQIRRAGHTIVRAYDDRLDICQMYIDAGIHKVFRMTTKGKCREIAAAMSY